MNSWSEITKIRLPLPFPLKIINAYLLRGEYGYTVLDTGLHTADSIHVWEEAQRKMGWGWDDVEKIVLTHYHPDHYGLAGWMQAQSGAPVYLSRIDYEQAHNFVGAGSTFAQGLVKSYGENGLSSQWVEQIPGHIEHFRPWVEPHPTPSFIAAGEMIRLGDRQYEIMHTPGHADGHLCFYDREREWLLAGDFLLPKITPNISMWPGGHPNPLRLFMESLNKMKELPVQTVFPAHGTVFHSYRERIEELERHHRERLDHMKGILSQSKGGMTAVECCFQHFGDRLSIHNLRFALSETLAHLEYLRLADEISRKWIDDHYVYLA
ncbi:MBL fold metallo-hydrolase [Mechercharimyces sp. CAU 1602]|uniref:MBL fold metallo-hydrolase n=1 Tax=Mechercharimyces sp. CAU 1602 TaxID=2973933 RepID=UPI002161615F|nr:MBL fold metallo-hydrolase [Mechercharimyces sp. CAU 1602]MCS1351782.1 MBL fold metallo-hydrolase [Mechercharimyces sp. CAU 1602]